MAYAKATVRGDKEIIANIRRAMNSVGGRELDRNIGQSMAPMKEQTQENAKALRNFVGKYPDFFPQPTKARRGGHLDEGVRVAKHDSRGMFYREFWLAFGKRSRKIAHLVEFGTLPHFQPNFKGGFHHPGAEAHPFARPAFEATKEEVVDEFGRNLWSQISGSLIGSFRR